MSVFIWTESVQKWKETVHLRVFFMSSLQIESVINSLSRLSKALMKVLASKLRNEFETPDFPDTKVSLMSEVTVHTKAKLVSIKVRVMVGLIVFTTIVVGGYFVQHLGKESDVEDEVVETRESTGSSDVITLPEGKMAKANFGTEFVEMQEVDHIHTVPGRLAYDEALHIEVKAPVSGVLLDVLVKPGDVVQAGQVLAIINSSEIGQARAALLNNEAKYQLTLKQMARVQEVTQNLEKLYELLGKDVAMDEIEKQFKDKTLGTYREQVMSAYAERFLAKKMYSASKSLSESGALSMKVHLERKKDLHVTDARFRSIQESTVYASKLKKQELEIELAEAERQVMIAEKHLQTLLGSVEEETKFMTGDSLSKTEICAPFAGTIESRFLARLERVRLSDVLFVLANTQSLYVLADIRENDWSVMSIQAGQEIAVEVPAIPGHLFTAKVHYIGRVVAIDSNSLPLVATIKNSDGLLRPGMFVRVEIPMAETVNVVAVPQESVLQHKDESFVFVKVNDHSFLKTDVKTGTSNEQWIEVTDGLELGQSIVSRGAVLLKSELLLAGEE